MWRMIPFLLVPGHSGLLSHSTATRLAVFSTASSSISLSASHSFIHITLRPATSPVTITHTSSYSRKHCSNAYLPTFWRRPFSQQLHRPLSTPLEVPSSLTRIRRLIQTKPTHLGSPRADHTHCIIAIRCIFAHHNHTIRLDPHRTAKDPHSLWISSDFN